MYDLDDYRRGALGSVNELPASLVDYLRFADGVQKRWAEDTSG